MILYLHGFNSSSASSKAQAMIAHCKQAGMACTAPDLPHRPAKAMELMAEICSQGQQVTAVGSSLGGYYATALVERGLAKNAVLINPAVDVAEKLRSEVDKMQTNYNDESTYLFTSDHVSDLEDMAVSKISEPGRYLLLVQKGDEILDYKEAVDYYAGCRQVVEEGGDHSFVGFERHLEDIVTWSSGDR